MSNPSVVQEVPINEGNQVEEAENIEIVDQTGTVYVVPRTVIEESGLDPDRLHEATAEQLQSILSSQPHTCQEDSANSAHEEQEGSSSAAPGPSLTLFVNDDGALQLTDLNGRRFHFTEDQLQKHGINSNNLSDETITQIIALAIPSGAVIEDRDTAAPPAKRQCVSDNRERERADSVETIDNGRVERAGAQSTSSTVACSDPEIHDRQRLALGKSMQEQGTGANILIGDEITVRRNGQTQRATVRYARTGTGYKVQFEDGHFAWVDQSDISMRKTTQGDHHGYSGRTQQPPAPYVVTSKMGPAERDQEKPNFCCPICSRKVYQRQPSFIVIRVPACDSCTNEKVVVLDDSS